MDVFTSSAGRFSIRTADSLQCLLLSNAGNIGKNCFLNCDRFVRNDAYVVRFLYFS